MASLLILNCLFKKVPDAFKNAVTPQEKLIGCCGKLLCEFKLLEYEFKTYGNIFPLLFTSYAINTSFKSMVFSYNLTIDDLSSRFEFLNDANNIIKISNIIASLSLGRVIIPIVVPTYRCIKCLNNGTLNVLKI